MLVQVIYGAWFDRCVQVLFSRRRGAPGAVVRMGHMHASIKKVLVVFGERSANLREKNRFSLSEQCCFHVVILAAEVMVRILVRHTYRTLTGDEVFCAPCTIPINVIGFVRLQAAKCREMRRAVIKSGLIMPLTSFMFPEKIFCSLFVLKSNLQYGMSCALILRPGFA